MPWDLKGNKGTNPTTNFLGTTDGQPLYIRTNDEERLQITADGTIHVGGNVGIGTPMPENAESWNKVLDILGDGNAKLSIRTSTGGIDARVLAHNSSWWGARPGMLIGTNSNHALSFATGASNRMTIDPSGEVAIRGSAIVGAGGWGRLKVRNIDGKHFQGPHADDDEALLLNHRSRQPVWIGHPDATANLLVNGNVGIGTLDPKHGRLMIETEAVPLALRERVRSVTEGGLWRMPLDAGALRFDVNTAPAGDFGSGSGPGPTTYLTPLTMHPTGHVTIGKDLNVVSGTIRTNDVFLNSDARLKSDIAPVADALGKLQKMRGVAFERLDFEKSSGSPTRRSGIGVIAQEVEDVFPELVDSPPDGGYKGVNYTGLTGVLVEASKELKKENEALRRRIEALEKAMGGSK